MLSASTHKSLTDLTRRKARSAFTILTLALAVASIGILAVPSLMRQAMDREVAANRMPDVTVSMPPLPMSAGELAALARVPNVTAVEPRTLFVTRVWIGQRRERAVVVGVHEFASQRADVVFQDSGSAPGPGAVLTDRNNELTKGFDAGAGGVARLVGADGRSRELPITGVGRNLTDGEQDPTNDWITFYATAETVEALSGAQGFTTLGLRLRDAGRPAVERTVAAVREQLRATTAFTAFDDLPQIHEPGTYPGQENVESIAGLLNVITVLALLTALVLVSNTMTTLVGEQTREIAAMKAIGARRRDIRHIYLRTALLLGALGALLGAALGVLLANLLAAFFVSLLGVDAGTGISLPVVAGSVALGIAGPAVAALPAVRRASRLPLAEALQATGSAVGGQGRLDRLLRRVRALPRSAQIGFRGLARRKRRSFATVLQISVAVATLLALLSVGAGVAQTTRGWFADNHFDVWIQAVASKPLDAGATRAIRSTDGVGAVQPWLQNQGRFDGRDVQVWGLPQRPMMNTHITDGRWYTAGEAAGAAKVAVLGPTIAKTARKDVGDTVEVATSNGPVTLTVIGISGNQADNGGVVFTPLTTLQIALGAPGIVNSAWITTTRAHHGSIDRTTTRLEDRLAARGNQVGSIVLYDMEEQQVAANAAITTTITVLGLLIVAISMVGLVNAITMSVLERTREIGMLRGVGARARDIRGIFATEGLVLAVTGWLLGVPVGYAFAQGLGWAAGEAVGLSIAFVFPVGYVAVALAGTVLLALAVMAAPVRRAVRFKPGEALRHA